MTLNNIRPGERRECLENRMGVLRGPGIITFCIMPATLACQTWPNEQQWPYKVSRIFSAALANTKQLIPGLKRVAGRG